MWGRNGIGEASREEGRGQGTLALASLTCDNFLLLCTGIPFIPPHGKSTGFLWGGGLGCLVPGCPVPLVLSPFPCGYCCRMHAGLSCLIYLFMNAVFFLCEHSCFQTFRQAAPPPCSCMGLAVEMSFLSILSSLMPCFD